MATGGRLEPIPCLRKKTDLTMTCFGDSHSSRYNQKSPKATRQQGKRGPHVCGNCVRLEADRLASSRFTLRPPGLVSFVWLFLINTLDTRSPLAGTTCSQHTCVLSRDGAHLEVGTIASLCRVSSRRSMHRLRSTNARSLPPPPPLNSRSLADAF